MVGPTTAVAVSCRRRSR
ncbi:Vmc-like lipoprotein signal peptide domain-containing protein [Streptomyces kanasensis]